MHERADTWKTIAAYVYLTICLFDFLIMPAYMVYSNKTFTQEIIQEIDLETDRKFTLEVVDKLSLKNWEPVTIYGGGLVFHLAFGAILTGAAVTDRKWVLTSSAGTGNATITSGSLTQAEKDEIDGKNKK